MTYAAVDHGLDGNRHALPIRPCNAGSLLSSWVAVQAPGVHAARRQSVIEAAEFPPPPAQDSVKSRFAPERAFRLSSHVKCNNPHSDKGTFGLPLRVETAGE
jgi:hypothetical protein